MSPELKKRVEAILANPNFLDQVGEMARARARAERAFAASETFQRMLAAVHALPRPVQLMKESFAFYPERAKAEAGWSFASDAEVDLFFAAMSDLHGAAVEPGSYRSDESNMFPNYSLRQHGLQVTVMTGQGVDIRITSPD